METFLTAIHAFIFGIVEGITEWLPISSTGHLMLLNQLYPLEVSPEFYDTFLVVIQLGAILAVILLYFHKLNPFAPSKTRGEKRETWGIWAKVVVGSIPAAIVGFALDSWMEEHVMNDSRVAFWVVAGALIIYGVIFILIERRNRRRIAEASARTLSARPAGRALFAAEGRAASQTLPARAENTASSGRHGKHARVEDQEGVSSDDDSAERDGSSAIAKVNSFSEMSYGKAFAIGIFQSLAVIPGTSRSGSTIIGSMLLGTSRTIATEFAFFLAIPIMFGWSLLKLIRHGMAYTQTEWLIFAVGIVTAFVVSILAIKFLIGYIKRNDFTAFGVYRIVLGIVVIAYFGSRALGFL